MSGALPVATILAVRDSCLCLHTQRAARALARRFDAAFSPFGITSGQFSLMVRLGAPQSPTVSEAAAFLAMDRTTLTAALKPLERRGLVAVTADAKDRRVKRLSLTAQGHALALRAADVWVSEHAALEAALEGVEPGLLRAALRRIA